MTKLYGYDRKDDGIMLNKGYLLALTKISNYEQYLKLP